MTGPLIIDEVYAELFGGLTNTRLPLGGEGLVVVHGPNESGKTTFATLLAWLLVGPTGKPADSLRFGLPSEQLSGRLSGTLDGQAVRIDATFKLLQKGLPNTNGITAQLAGQPLDLSAWRTSIGGIDDKVLTATYRMWGADLHSDDGVLAEITQATLAGLGGGQRLGDVVAVLQKQILEYLTARADGAESFSALGIRRGVIDAHIKAISDNASTYQRHADEVAEVAEQLRISRTRANELDATVAAIRALQSVTKERHREHSITEELTAMATVPAEWMAVVDPVQPFLDAAAAADAGIEQARAVEREVQAAAAQLGLSDIEAEQLRVTHATVTAVQVTLTRLETARTGAQTAEAAHRDAEARARAADDAAHQTLLACPEVQADALRARPLSETDVRPLRTAVTEWSTAERQVVGAHTAVSAAQTRVDIAVAALHTAHAQWERLGTGVTAQQWRVTPPAPTPVAPVVETTPTASGRPWLPVAVAGAVALLAVLLLPRWAGVGVTAAAFAGVVFTLRRNRVEAGVTSPVEPVSPADPALDAHILDAANATVAAQSAADQAHDDLRRLEADLARLQRDTEHPYRSVTAECQRLGLTVGDTPVATADTVDRALLASVAVTAASREHRALVDAARVLDEARSEVTRVSGELCDTLTAAGVPSGAPCEQTAAVIDTLRSLTELVAQHRLAERVADDARQAFETMIAVLGDAAAERSRASLVAEAERLAELHATRVRLIAERDRLNHDINTRFREHPAAKALAAQRRSDAEWAAELALRVDELAQAENERDDLNRRLGELRQAMDQLMNTDELAQQRLESGMVSERADEALLAGVVAVAARSLVTRVAGERRRTHQPALVARAGSLLSTVATDWQQLLVDPTDNGAAEVTVVDAAGAELAATRLSTGARALTHLALRLATAELDAERRRVRFPIICDDPLVHLDDDRAQAVMPLLAKAAADGHQVIVFTCHGRTVDAAVAAGGRVVSLA